MALEERQTTQERLLLTKLPRLFQLKMGLGLRSFKVSHHV